MHSSALSYDPHMDSDLPSLLLEPNLQGWSPCIRPSPSGGLLWHARTDAASHGVSMCRFIGTLPESWADPNLFLSLRVLNLQNNQLSGPLPNCKWSRSGGWRKLETLDLSRNRFHGEYLGHT
jgi:hypothetical protein